MEIRLLKKGYKKNKNLYKDFLEDKIKNNKDYFTDEKVIINDAPDFPIYMGNGIKNKNEDFEEAFEVISETYVNLEREISFNETFWHSFLLVHKREYILKKYPQIKDNENEFKNIILKKFNWENYIYKILLASQYITDNIEKESERSRIFKLIIKNLDLYNYIIKAEIFRNDKFLLNILNIVEEYGLSSILKEKIKDSNKDDRYGRKVIFEFNKSYPIVMAPMLEKEELESIFIKYLGYYYNKEISKKKIINN